MKLVMAKDSGVTSLKLACMYISTSLRYLRISTSYFASLSWCTWFWTLWDLWIPSKPWKLTAIELQNLELGLRQLALPEPTAAEAPLGHEPVANQYVRYNLLGGSPWLTTTTTEFVSFIWQTSVSVKFTLKMSCLIAKSVMSFFYLAIRYSVKCSCSACSTWWTVIFMCIWYLKFFWSTRLWCIVAACFPACVSKH